jgi:hypothetical protein
VATALSLSPRKLKSSALAVAGPVIPIALQVLRKTGITDAGYRVSGCPAEAFTVLPTVLLAILPRLPAAVRTSPLLD